MEEQYDNHGKGCVIYTMIMVVIIFVGIGIAVYKIAH